MRYSPRIWQKGTCPFSVVHQLGKRVVLSSNIFSIYASRIYNFINSVRVKLSKKSLNSQSTRRNCYWANRPTLASIIQRRERRKKFEKKKSILVLTVNSVTWMDSDKGLNIPASLYIARIKATHVVDLPSLYIQSSCSGMVSNCSNAMPRSSISIRISCKSKPWS